MRKATLQRQVSDDSGTFGILTTDTGKTFQSAECPWRNNSPNISCIPPGTYRCVWGLSPSHGNCFHVTSVPARTHILIHIGNFAGDIDKGLRSDVKGCIMLGRIVGEIYGQKALKDSTWAVRRFENEMKWAPFELTILAPLK